MDLTIKNKKIVSKCCGVKVHTLNGIYKPYIEPEWYCSKCTKRCELKIVDRNAK